MALTAAKCMITAKVEGGGLDLRATRR
jgi:hypothetical protein